jgi:hypothetical protein
VYFGGCGVGWETSIVLVPGWQANQGAHSCPAGVGGTGLLSSPGEVWGGLCGVSGVVLWVDDCCNGVVGNNNCQACCHRLGRLLVRWTETPYPARHECEC